MFSVKHFQFFAVFIIALSNVFANVLINDKLCDPSGTNYIPYSGLRFYKKNELSIIGNNNEEPEKFSQKGNQGLPSYKSNILVSLCSNGKNLFNINNHLHDKETNMNWNSTICLKFNHFDNVQIKSSSTNLFSKIFSKQILKELKSVKNFNVKELIDFEPILATNNAFINNITEENINDQDIYNSLMESDIKCFKFARNEKYHSRKSQIFKPLSQIGGIFQCHLNQFTYSFVTKLFEENSKAEDFEGKKFIDIIEMSNFDCNQNIPISPIYSDNVYFQWIKFKFTPFFLSRKSKTKLKLHYFIPLFYTPNDINNNFLMGNIWQLFKKFKGTFAPNKNSNRWYSNIDINEFYENKESEKSTKFEITLKKLSRQVNVALNNFDEIVIEIIKHTKKIFRADSTTKNEAETKGVALQATNNLDLNKKNNLVLEVIQALYDNVELDNDLIDEKKDGKEISTRDDTSIDCREKKILRNYQSKYLQTLVTEDIYKPDEVNSNKNGKGVFKEKKISIVDLKKELPVSIDSDETEIELGNFKKKHGDSKSYKRDVGQTEILDSKGHIYSVLNLADAKIFLKENMTKETFSFFYNNLNFSERLMFFVCIIKKKRLLGINLESFFKQLITT